jgi:hypothetical protein
MEPSHCGSSIGKTLKDMIIAMMIKTLSYTYLNDDIDEIASGTRTATPAVERALEIYQNSMKTPQQKQTALRDQRCKQDH